MNLRITAYTLLLFIIVSTAGCAVIYPKKRIAKQAQKKNGKVVEITKNDRKELQRLLTKVIGRSLFEKKRALKRGNDQRWKRKSSPGIMRVYATSFGKPGNKGESNYFKDGSKVRWGLVAVALPDNSAIGKWIDVRSVSKSGKRGNWVRMKVKDLGPWFRDDPYWKKRSRTPRAVYYYKKKKRRFDNRVVVNPAGLDITPWGWQKMGISAKRSYNHSQHVEWRFTRS